MAIIRYNDGDAGDAFTSTTGTNINITSTGLLTGTSEWAYTSSSAANIKNWLLGSGQPTVYSVWLRFRVSSFSSAAQRLIRMTEATQTNACWHVDLTGTAGTPGRLRLRTTNAGTLLNEFTNAIALNTNYIAQVDANHTTGVLTLTLRSSTGAVIETYTSSAGQTIYTEGDRLDFGAILGSVTGLNYLFEGYWADTYEGPTGSTPVPGVATYGLTITHTTDLATIAARTYQLDTTSSTGTTTLVWSGGSRGTITESPTGVFTISDPNDGDAALSLVLTAAGVDGGADDVLPISVPRGSAEKPAYLTYRGGTISDIANWA